MEEKPPEIGGVEPRKILASISGFGWKKK